MDRRKNRYIESKKGQTRTYQAREVHNRALPNCSHEIDESLGIDMTQEERRLNWEWVWLSGINLMQRRGKVEGVLGWECVDEEQGGQRVQECNVRHL